MEDQADVRRGVYKDKYGTECYVISVKSGYDFAVEWNKWFTDFLSGETIDAIEIISHGGATGISGKDSSGTGYGTGFLYFGDDPNNNRLFARDNYNMNSSDCSVSWLDPVTAKELNINACNSANPDVYNVVFGFMQKVNYSKITGWDGGTEWDPELGDHVRGGGDYSYVQGGILHSDPWYYVKEYQATWWKYVEKDENGNPKRERIGKREFYS